MFNNVLKNDHLCLFLPDTEASESVFTTTTSSNRNDITSQLKHIRKLTRNLLELQKAGVCCDVRLSCQDGYIDAHSGTNIKLSSFLANLCRLHSGLICIAFCLSVRPSVCPNLTKDRGKIFISQKVLEVGT